MSSPSWLDLSSDAVISPLGARRAPDLGPVAVMVSVEPDLRQMISRVGPTRSHAFFMGTLAVKETEAGGWSITGPYVGAPYGVMLLESLIARGAKRIIVMGWCGAVSPELVTGDIVIPGRALCDDGTSRNYMVSDTDFPEVLPSPGLVSSFRDFLTRKNQPFRTGTVWSTDAIYRETAAKIDHFRGLGADVVEMECSALFAVAAFRKVDIASVLVVSDEVSSVKWKPGFRDPAFKEARSAAVTHIIDFCSMNQAPDDPDVSR